MDLRAVEDAVLAPGMPRLVATGLTIALPPGLTATALADSTGGWICTLNTLTCTRATSINASASDSVTLTVSVPAYPPGGLASYTGLLTVTISSPNFSSNVTASDTVIFQQPPPINWATPAPIVYGISLSAAQLDATSPLGGTFSYSPAAGTVLGVVQANAPGVDAVPPVNVDVDSAAP